MAPKRSLNKRAERSLVSRWKAGETQAELAAELGVSKRTVVNVLRRHGAGGEANAGDRKRPKQGGDPASIAAYERLGAPPADSLLAVGWVQTALATAIQHVLVEKGLTESARRRELRELAAAMSRLVPLDRLGQAEQLVLGDLKKLKQEDGPEVVDASELGPAGHWATAKRGRPRK